jgi:ABC-2 type transport system permease protein
VTTAQRLRILRRFFLKDLVLELTYRGEFVLYMLSVITTPVISLLIWRAALASGADLPVDRQYLTTYFVLLGVVNMLTSSWLDIWLAEMIRMGNLSIWLVRPGSAMLNLIANNLSEKTFKLAVLAPMIAVFWWFFRSAVVVPSDPVRWLLMFVSIVFGAVILFALDIVVGSLAFWLTDVGGISRGRALLVAVLSGQIVPLVLMPAWAGTFVRAQPFRYTVSFPLELMVSDLSARQVALGFAAQIVYAGLFLWGAVWIWRRGLRSYGAVGA